MYHDARPQETKGKKTEEEGLRFTLEGPRRSRGHCDNAAGASCSLGQARAFVSRRYLCPFLQRESLARDSGCSTRLWLVACSRRRC